MTLSPDYRPSQDGPSPAIVPSGEVQAMSTAAGSSLVQMGKADQIRFVTELCDSIRCGVVDGIARGKVPPHWTGRQLRRLLADRFKLATVKLTRQQVREYNNEILIHNL